MALQIHCTVQDSHQEVIHEQCYMSCEIFLKGQSTLMDVIIITFFEAQLQFINYYCDLIGEELSADIDLEVQLQEGKKHHPF